MKPFAVFVCEVEANIDRVYGHGRRKQLETLVDLYPVIINSKNFDEHLSVLAKAEVIFSTWGMIKFSDRQLDAMSALKAVFYAAGVTDAFARPLLARGITLVSAWQANAIPVAEFCTAQIILALKGFFRSSREFKSPRQWVRHPDFPGVFEDSVALIGAGAISVKTQELLSNYKVKVMVVASRLERRTISLEEAFSSAYVVSNHLPNRSDNVGVLNGRLFRMMRPGAVFINTGRGAQVNEPELIQVLKERPDLTALLDVTDPEPPAKDSELYHLPNVMLSPHIAGSTNNETWRLADYVIEEFGRWQTGGELSYRISEEMLVIS